MHGRRRFLFQFGTAAIALPGLASAQDKDNVADQVAPVEDLMREHGALNRILLIYDETLRRLNANHDYQPATLHSAAGLIHTFIEGYHEKLEEQHIFPRLESAGKLVDEVRTLRTQHEAGRIVTARILDAGDKETSNRAGLTRDLGEFIRMYRPHEAREDTVIFPAFKTVVAPPEYANLGEVFEDRERALFGENGFENVVNQIADLERSLGIYELGQFTPRV